jgi:ElaB/YqjD/DUF883 family membrane-anchored ribosome-binding protein
MAFAVRTEHRTEPCQWPTLESVKDNLRDARRTVATTRHAAEEFAAGAAVKIGRHPLRVVGMAVVAGAVFGSLIGFGAGWCARTCKR